MTSVLTPPSVELFRTAPLNGLPQSGKVVRTDGKILGAKAMQIGPLSEGDARPWKVDAITLSQLEKAVNSRNIGTKSRFTHPNMSNDGMGRHLGRATNARRVSHPDGDYTAVDLALSEAAKTSPNGDLYSHVLDLAEQTPEDFGLSIVPLLDREAMNKIEPDENGLIPIRIKALRAIDVVDEPAATRGGLFSLDSDHLADLPAQATELLDTFFADSPADVIRARFGAFLQSYLQHRGDDEMSTKPEPKPTPNVDEQLAAANAEIAQLKAQIEVFAKPNPASGDAEKTAARVELERIGQIEALCLLAGVDGAKKELILKAGFSRSEAQEYLSKSGFLSAKNPPIGEGGTDLGEKKSTPEDKFGAEYDAASDVFSRQGVSREAYIKSRLKG